MNDGHTFTTSLKVAEHFRRRHKNVIQAIEKMIADVAELEISRLNFQPSDSRVGQFCQLNFQPADYKNKRGKSYPVYKISRDGFAILAMGFTGVQALVWKIDFLAAFDQAESQLRAHVAREAAALHQLRPLLAPVVAGTEQGLRRIAIGGAIGRSAASVSYHRRTARRLGLLPILSQGGVL